MDLRNLPRAAETAAQKGHNQFGKLPQWNLDDLYPGNDSNQLKLDLAKARAEAKAFETDYKGKLATLTAEGKLVEAIKRYEALSYLTGRLGSYAFLQYVRFTQDGARVKFLGDTSQALTDLSTGLIFFGLELNRIDEAALEAAFSGSAELARYRPWFDELRKAKPYQLDDRTVVADGQALEAPVFAQQVVHQPGVGGGGHSVYFVKRHHHAARTGFYCRAVRRKILIIHAVQTHIYGIVVSSAFSGTVQGKVLNAGQCRMRSRQVGALVAAHHGRNGSSPLPSAMRPHRGSRHRSTMGEKTQFMPSAVASVADTRAVCSINDRFHVQLSASGIGKVVS